MILAAGLTPAWQHTLVFDDFYPGEVNRAAENYWCASGKVINVGYAASRLSEECVTLSIGGGWALDAIQEELSGLDLIHRWVATRTPTRVCTTVINRTARKTTELVENAGALRAEELDAYERQFRDEVKEADVVVLSGSLPANTPVTYYRTLAAAATGKVILDIRGPELLATLDLKPFLVKPNRSELAHTLGRPLDTDADLIAGMQELAAKGAQWVLITAGAQAIWLANEKAVYRCQPPPREVINPIGSGDCLAAGIAYGLEQGQEMLEAARWGLAAASENLRHLLPARIHGPAVREIITQMPFLEAV